MKPNEMSVRDYMAMNFACQTLSKNFPQNDYAKELCAEECYRLADAFIKHSKQTDPDTQPIYEDAATEEVKEQSTISSNVDIDAGIAFEAMRRVKTIFPSARTREKYSNLVEVIVNENGAAIGAGDCISRAWYSADMFCREKGLILLAMFSQAVARIMGYPFPEFVTKKH